MIGFEDYFQNGYKIQDTDLKSVLSKLRMEFISVFSEASSAAGFDPLSNELEIIKMYEQKDRGVWVAAYDQLRYLPSILGLANNHEIINIVKKCGIKFPIFCSRPIVRADMPNDLQQDFPPHQDYSYNLGSLNSITIWIPLQDVDIEMGALEIISGSHIGGAVPSKNGLIINPDLNKYTPVPIKLGQILVFSQFLHHKSGKNKSQKIRFSIQLRYNDLSDESWSKRKFYINQKILEKTRTIEYETHFPRNKVITIET